MEKPRVVFIIGPTGSGKSSRAVREAQERNGEIISVDSRQVYRTLDIGTEKISVEEMGGIPHHLIDIRDPEESYSAGDFIQDAPQLISDILSRGKLPILAGGTHFYFDALLYGLPEIPPDEEFRASLEQFSNEELHTKIVQLDAERAADLDPANRRRLIRALEIIETKGIVPKRTNVVELPYEIEWIVIDLPREELRTKIDLRLEQALDRGLIEEVRRTRERVGDIRLNELGLEYRVVGEYLRDERSEESIFPALSSKLWHYARRQKAWLRKLKDSADTD